SAVGDGHRQMGLPSAGLAVQDQRPALGDEVDPEIGADQRFPKSGLQREVELVDGLEEGEVRVSGTALDAGLLPSRYFFGQQKSEQVPIGPAFLLSPARDLFVDPAHVRQVQTPEVNLELALGELQALRCVVDLCGHQCTSRITPRCLSLHGLTSWKTSQCCKKCSMEEALKTCSWSPSSIARRRTSGPWLCRRSCSRSTS